MSAPLINLTPDAMCVYIRMLAMGAKTQGYLVEPTMMVPYNEDMFAAIFRLSRYKLDRLLEELLKQGLLVKNEDNVYHLPKQIETTCEETIWAVKKRKQRQKKEGEDKKKPTKEAPKEEAKEVKSKEVMFPEHLNTETFKAAWLDWVRYRKEKKKTLTYSSVKREINFLAKYSEDVAIKILNQSIMNGWTGIFELKQNYSNSTPAIKKKDYEDMGDSL